MHMHQNISIVICDWLRCICIRTFQTTSRGFTVQQLRFLLKLSA